MRRKKRGGLEESELSLVNLVPYLPKPQGPSQIKRSLLPALLVQMKYSLAGHSSIVEQHPSLSVNNIGLYGICELTAMVLLDVPPRLFILQCWYGGEHFTRLPCRTINPHRKKHYISCPLHTDKLLWYRAYKKLTVDMLVDLFIDEIQTAFDYRSYAIMNISRDMVKAFVTEMRPVVALGKQGRWGKK